MRELAFLNRGVHITLYDEREEVEERDDEGNVTYTGILHKVFHSEGGLTEFVKFLDQAREPLHSPPIYISGIDDEQTVPVEVPLQYNRSYSENLHSYVNNINTIEGGTHVSGFKKALTRSMKAYADRTGILQKLKIEISGMTSAKGSRQCFPSRCLSHNLKAKPKPSLGMVKWLGLWKGLLHVHSMISSRKTPLPPN
jgi:DNA gyrase subunit B